MLNSTLSELSSRIISGLTPLRSNSSYWVDGIVPWLKTEQLGDKYVYETNECISHQALENTSIKLVPENTLSIAMYGEGKTRGNVSIIKASMTTNQACCNVVLDSKKADHEYIYYFLKTQYSELRNLSSGVRKNLNSNDIKGFNIRHPEKVKDQRELVEALIAIDNKIDLNNRINAELEAMAKTLYDYWFVQFDFPNANGKPYKTSGGIMVYNETLEREIPEGWDVSNVASWIRGDKAGDWGKESNQGNYDLEVNCIRGADINGIKGNGKVASPTRFILSKNNHKLLSEHEFIIEISGGSPTQSTGRIAWVTADMLKRFSRPLICSNFCKAVSLFDKCYFFNFAQLWTSFYENKILFSWEGKTSGIKNFLFEAFITNHMTVKPPLDLTQKFYEFAEPIEKKKQSLLLENQQLEELRDWLLPMLMNGQVTVK